MTLRSLIFMYKHKKACKRLQAHRDSNYNAPATRSYREHREAALKATRREVD